MANLDLKTDKGLREACKRAESKIDGADIDKVAQFLEQVHNTPPEERSGEPFVRLVWEQNPLDGLGHGDYPLEDAYTNAGFRDGFARQINVALPQAEEQRLEAIKGLVSDTGRLAQKFVAPNKSGRQDRPISKTHRALAALFPLDFTPPANPPTLTYLAEAMDLPMMHKSHYAQYVEKSRGVIDRLDKVLGSFPESDWTALATRRLLAQSLGNLCAEPVPDLEPRLQPLTASQRIRGLTAFGGMWERLLHVVKYVKNNPTEDELLEYMRTGVRDKKDGSLKKDIKSIKREFNVYELQRNRYFLTATGKRLLETRNPDAVRDRLLTGILGPDHVLVALRKQVRTKQDVTELLKRVNPGWKDLAAPNQIVSWLRALEVVEIDPGSNLVLTERGRQWAERIHWEPEFLGPLPPPPPREQTPLGTILERFEGYRAEEGLVFDAAMVEALHLGLWANERRHFAVLTGLSGTGKTKLALRYGQALTGAEDERTDRMCVVSVEPGWHDPSSLLGFVNPLNENAYQRTDFVEFLTRANENPSEPYVALLDEMNLSHPEQYLAPLISAMERRAGHIKLHKLDEEEAGIPQRISYPPNLVLIGTVNMDETTMGLSDKVLDRAFTLEFWHVDVDRWPGWDEAELGENKQKVRGALNDLMNVLSPARLHFGWRVIEETVRFMERRRVDSANLSATAALDCVIYAKVLPKLRGDDSQRYHTALSDCQRVLSTHELRDSAKKVQELRQDLDQTGSFRFWR